MDSIIFQALYQTVLGGEGIIVERTDKHPNLTELTA